MSPERDAFGNPVTPREGRSGPAVPARPSSEVPQVAPSREPRTRRSGRTRRRPLFALRFLCGGMVVVPILLTVAVIAFVATRFDDHFVASKRTSPSGSLTMASASERGTLSPDVQVGTLRDRPLGSGSLLRPANLRSAMRLARTRAHASADARGSVTVMPALMSVAFREPAGTSGTRVTVWPTGQVMTSSAGTVLGSRLPDPLPGVTQLAAAVRRSTAGIPSPQVTARFVPREEMGGTRSGWDIFVSSAAGRSRAVRIDSLGHEIGRPGPASTAATAGEGQR